MGKEVFIPKLGQTVEEVSIVQWLASDGEKVDQGQEILEVETDKAVFPVEAPAKGYLHIGPYADGQVVPVLEVVAMIGRQEERFAPVHPAQEVMVEEPFAREAPPATLTPTAQPPAPSQEAEERRFVSPRARRLAQERGVSLDQVAATGEGGVRIVERDVVNYLQNEPKSTPLAQRIAAGAGLDLRAVDGTGPGGRVMKDDVLRVSAEAGVGSPAPERYAIPLGVEVAERVPLRGVRQVIAERMATSAHATARVTLMMDADATRFVSMRERIKVRVAEEWGFSPGYNDLLGMMVARSLRKFPYVNVRLANDAVEVLANVNLGMAVDTERGLLVPVLRNADRMTLRELGSEFRALVERARNGRSMPDDLTGGTFTITNLGMYDVDAFTPVINLPEAAILGVGRIAERVIPRKGKPSLRQMWTLSLAFDHRLIDGAPAARFLQYLKQMIEEPYLMLAA